jgi:hypothetical protein
MRNAAVVALLRLSGVPSLAVPRIVFRFGITS